MKNTKCKDCGRVAVGYFPMSDVDAILYSYCRSCLDSHKHEMMIRLTKIQIKYEKAAKEGFKED